MARGSKSALSKGRSGSTPSRGFFIIQDHIEKGDFSRIYFFYGEERYLIDEYLRRLVDVLIDEASKDFDLVIIDGEKATARRVVGAAMALPLLNERKVVIVRGFDSMDADEKEVLASFLTDIPESTCLILIAEKKPDGRTKLASQLQELGTLVEFSRPSKREVTAWLVKKFRQSGREISPEGVSLLVETVGSDLTRLENEVEKLLLYLGEEKKMIEVEDIRVLSPRTVEHTIFELTDAVGRRDKSLALRDLDDLFREGQPYTMLLFMLVRQVRMLLRTRILIDHGARHSSDILSSLPIKSPYEAEKFYQQAKNFTRLELVRALERLREADVNIKTGGMEPRLELEMVIMAICERGE